MVDFTGHNTAIGYQAMYNHIGGFSFGGGDKAMYNSSGYSNVGIGQEVMYNNTGDYNVGMSAYALYKATGSYNIGIGAQNLRDLLGGTYNTSIGHLTGRGIVSGNYNTILGAQVTGLASALSNNIIIADGQGNQRIRVLSNGDTGINTSAPTAALDVNGDTVRLRTSKTPATAGAAGNQGDMAWDSGYVYICVSSNTWKRAAIATW